jgi:hypothetical protein
MAEWCAVAGQPPSVYKELSQLELYEFFRAGKRVKGLK